MESLVKQNRALLGALAWWYLRRRLRHRAEAVAGLVSSESLGLRQSPKSGGAWWKWLLALTGFGGVAWLAWRHLRGGGGDDWASWEPSAPEPPTAVMPDPAGSPSASPDPVVPAGA